MQAPVEDESLSEADEAAQLAPLATLSAEDAAAAASAAVTGDDGKVELDNENGAVVYSVEITASTGAETDVKVDLAAVTVPGGVGQFEFLSGQPPGGQVGAEGE